MGFRDVCFKFYRIVQRLIIPELKYSQTIYEEIISDYAERSRHWLDLGCGRGLLPPWRSEQELNLIKKVQLLVGCDYDEDSLRENKTIENRVRGNISSLPFATNSFELITSNMVFEHLNDPDQQLAEIYRILRPNGILIFHTPNLSSYGPILGKLIPESLKARLIWILQNRKEEDVFPTYYKINSRKRIENICTSAGFKIIKLRYIVSSPQFIMIPPLLLLELLFIKLLMTRLGKSFRSNIIAILEKSETIMKSP